MRDSDDWTSIVITFRRSIYEVLQYLESITIKLSPITTSLSIQKSAQENKHVFRVFSFTKDKGLSHREPACVAANFVHYTGKQGQ
jgi:hypothetical protein